MKYIRQAITTFLCLLVFILPLHLAYIIKDGRFEGDASGWKWQQGTIALYPIDGVMAILMFFAVIYGVWYLRRYGFARCVSRIRERLGILPFFFLIGFLIAARVTILWSPDRELALVSAARMGEGAILFFLITLFSFPLSRLYGAFFLGGLAQGGFAVWQFIEQIVPANAWLGTAFHAPAVKGDAVVEVRGVRVLRAYGSFPHPNSAAAFLAGAYGAALQYMEVWKGKLASILFLIGGAAIVIGLFFTFSRSAWLALLLFLCAACVRGGMSFFSKRRQIERNVLDYAFSLPVVSVILSCVVIVVLGVAYKDIVLTRLGFVSAPLESRSIKERIDSFDTAFDMIQTRWFGTGIGQYSLVRYQEDKKKGNSPPSYQYQPVHSLPLLVLGEIGVVGFLFFALFLCFIFRAAGTLFRPSAQSFPYAAAFFFCVLVTAGLTDHFLWTQASGNLLFWIACACIVREYKKSR